jgi:uncharacterized protein (TIRG00374 family)
MIHFVGVGEVIAVMREAKRPYLFLVALGLQFMAMGLWAVRWKILLSLFNSVSVTNAFKGILIGIFFNNVTPVARAGGEPFRAYYVEKKEGVDFENAFATVAIDRILDSLPFLIIIMVSLLYFVFLMDISIQMIIILIIALIFNVILLSLVLYFSLNLRAAKKLAFSILRFAARFSQKLLRYETKIESAIEQYHLAIRTFSLYKKKLFFSFILSFIFWFSVVLRNYLIIQALGYDVRFMTIVVIQMVGTLVGIFPIFPGGLGSIEGIMIFLYFSFNFPMPVAASASLLDRLISFWITTACGALIVFIERKVLIGKQVRQRESIALSTEGAQQGFIAGNGHDE